MKLAMRWYAVNIVTAEREVCWVFDDEHYAHQIAQGWRDGGAMVCVWRL